MHDRETLGYDQLKYASKTSSIDIQRSSITLYTCFTPKITKISYANLDSYFHDSNSFNHIQTHHPQLSTHQT